MVKMVCPEKLKRAYMPAIAFINPSINSGFGLHNTSAVDFPLPVNNISNSSLPRSKLVADSHDLAYRAYVPKNGNELQAEVIKLYREKISRCSSLYRNIKTYRLLPFGPQFAMRGQHHQDKLKFKKESCEQFLDYYRTERATQSSFRHPCNPRHQYDGSVANFVGKILLCNKPFR